MQDSYGGPAVPKNLGMAERKGKTQQDSHDKTTGTRSPRQDTATPKKATAGKQRQGENYRDRTTIIEKPGQDNHDRRTTP
jgi:hypothetical protein